MVSWQVQLWWFNFGYGVRNDRNTLILLYNIYFWHLQKMIETILYISTTLVVTILAVFYLYKKWAWSYWSRRGVETYEPNNFMDIGLQYYESYFHFKKRGLKHGGTYLFFLPHYIPVDLDIIKRILIADFDNFVNRGLFEIPPKEDDISAHLFNLKDHRWRVLRNKLSPTFTSGN